MTRVFVAMCSMILVAIPVPGKRSEVQAQAEKPENFALVNGQWFNGKSFEARMAYSVNGQFTAEKPARVDRTLDLAGTWIVPPFGEAHNHSLGTGRDEVERNAIRKCLADGVFYVKIPGNLPLTDEDKARLGINRHDSVDAVFAHGNLTATGGHPVLLVETILLPQGYYPGFTKETLKDHRYFTIDSETDLDEKWPLILGHHPDFIKTMLMFSDEFERRSEDPAYFGRKGLDPRLLPKIVAKAHANHLRVSTHVNTAADFHHAVEAGVDEVSHLPPLPLPDRFAADISFKPIAVEDAKLAAQRGIVICTTASTFRNRSEAVRERLLQVQKANLKLLHEQGVPLVIGSDNPDDSSLQEIEHLRVLGEFDNLTLIKMWCEATAKSIFPKRKIGELREGYEASFLALEGNPVEDFQNVRKIKFRFKQGYLLKIQVAP